MQNDDNIAHWLTDQPLDEPIEIDGESVYLKVHATGAELGVYLMHSFKPDQLQQALRQGFSSAAVFDAGLGLTPDGEHVVLNQWLPGVQTWTEALDPLEKLLNQVGSWRVYLSPSVQTKVTNAVDRNEQRLRKLFPGAKK